MSVFISPTSASKKTTVLDSNEEDTQPAASLRAHKHNDMLQARIVKCNLMCARIRKYIHNPYRVHCRWPLHWCQIKHKSRGKTILWCAAVSGGKKHHLICVCARSTTTRYCTSKAPRLTALVWTPSLCLSILVRDAIRGSTMVVSQWRHRTCAQGKTAISALLVRFPGLFTPPL